MKSIAELPLVGLIGTFTLILGVVTPSVIVKTTLDKELAFNYEFERAQHSLLTLLLSEQGNRDTYDALSKNYLLNTPIDSNIVNTFDRLMNTAYRTDYCVSIIEDVNPENPSESPRATKLLGNNCESSEVQFNTIFVVPYNKDSLVKVIGIGLQ